MGFELIALRSPATCSTDWAGYVPLNIINLSQKTEEGSLSNSFTEARNSMIVKPDKGTTKTPQTDNSDEHTCKYPQLSMFKPNSNAH